MSRLAVRHPLPLAVDVEELVGTLLDRPVTVAPTPPPPASEPVSCSVFRCDSGELAGMVIADAAFVTASGAALALIPPETVVEAASSGIVDPALFTNFREVANVASRWFNGPDWPHVLLTTVHGLGEHPPAGTMVFRFAPRARRDYLVEIEGYAAGRLSILAN